MAVTGPFAKTVINTPYAYKHIGGYRQTPPYLERLSYEMISRYVYKGTGSPSGASYSALDSSPAYQPALDKAYEKFRNNLHEKAELAVSLAEGRQAVEMIAKRCTQITSFLRNLRKGDLVGALGALGIQPPKKSARKKSNAEKSRNWDQARRRSRKTRSPVSDTFTEAFDSFSGPSSRAGRAFRKKQTKSVRQRGEVASDVFLEFHFGWVPLVKDIGAAIDVLQRPFDAVVARGRGTATAVSGSKPSPGSFGIADTHVWTSKVQLIADIRVTNPNLYLANKLGLVNPAVVVWELVPFSFVLDWFVNVSSFLAQATETLGLDLIHASTMHYLIDDVSTWYGSSPVSEITFVHGAYCRRSNGISKPGLQLKPFHGFSLTRAVTSVSLLLQQLKGVK